MPLAGSHRTTARARVDAPTPDDARAAPQTEPAEPELMHRVFIDTPQQRYRLNVDAATSRRHPRA